MSRTKPRFHPRPRVAPPGALTGLHPVREALRARRRALGRLHLSGVPRPEWADLQALAREAGVGVVVGDPAPPELADQRPWVWLEAGPLPELELEALLAGAKAPGATLVALDGVEDPQNLGAIARAADATGVAGIVLTRRHAPPLSEAVSRASAGAIEWVPVSRVPNLNRALGAMKDAGFWVIGADLEAPVDLFEAPDAWLRAPRVLVVGAEGVGLRQGVIQALDHRVRIPMTGQVASLNVSAATAVVLFELKRRDASRGKESGPSRENGNERATRPPPASRSC